jgi:hypothetical protein
MMTGDECKCEHCRAMVEAHRRHTITLEEMPPQGHTRMNALADAHREGYVAGYNDGYEDGFRYANTGVPNRGD